MTSGRLYGIDAVGHVLADWIGNEREPAIVGDQLLTLIVPCPPNSGNVATASRQLGVRTSRTSTSKSAGCPSVPAGKLMYVAYWPSGDRCGNQSTVSELTSCSRRPPSAGIRAS